jgi:hypothetical protein
MRTQVLLLLQLAQSLFYSVRLTHSRFVLLAVSA